MRLPSFRLTVSAVVALFPVAALAGPPQAAVAPDAGCVQQKGGYVCNWSSFKTVFDRAHTVALEVSPMDRPTVRQLDTLVSRLGKTRVTEGGSGDLVFLLMPIEPTGVNIGPMDHDLATLRVYAPANGSAHGTLLWAETLRGQGDRPWPAQVHLLLAQFEGRFGRR
jgi:hypothetical protein